uniref:ABM domain-containing protein n=1 Tax=Chromera velia CCMP2878 TaxID=1169474 RepID=A0A0G4GPB0_9ALVE|eukprot:Cvel_22780.t1-p1 / transcript=Cvel_22780.t1 / gene=Cvel_22780 / organism=Chromera_velia_CCMP2878 / gene_product=Alcohol dehydrogenase 4, putative / transcript_product=Alcohol dehydrogenase 4, putative / location=Cvel_scaffold2277:19273-29683(-) / protein_length=710 / sequence_SO=supercontig / SO=protein_coding / is_pseudo=false
MVVSGLGVRLSLFLVSVATSAGAFSAVSFADKLSSPLQGLSKGKVTRGGKSLLAMTDSNDYLAVHVFGKVKPGTNADFLKASLNNAGNSVHEPGVARFDVLTGTDNPEAFCLIEVYKNAGAPGAHKETAHYNKWRETVADMMAEPRSAKKYKIISPSVTSGCWDTEAEAAGRTILSGGPEKFLSEEVDAAAGSGGGLLCVFVDVQVTPGGESLFIEASKANAANSIKEPGVSRFDLLQNVEDPSNFVLVEVYNSKEGPARHKETAHYKCWRETVESIMARPRQALKFQTVFPSRVHWHRTERVTHVEHPGDKAGEGFGFDKGFEFASAGKIVFGSGAASKLPQLVKERGCSKACVVTGKGGKERFSELLGKLQGEGVQLSFFACSPEPTIEECRDAVKVARDAGADSVVAIGGGSSIDMGKAVAALLGNGGDPMDYAEVIGKGQVLSNPSVPFFALPTTAGTGSEVTKNSVLKSEEHGRKVSIRSNYMLPDLAIVDPQLTVSVPPDVTAHTGLDALTQCIEPFVSCNANPVTDALAREGIKRAARSLRAVYRDGSDLRAREDLAVASVIGGLCLANAKLGAVHGFAGVLGGLYPSPHGAVCAALLPFCFSGNVKALKARAESDPKCLAMLSKFDEVAQMVTNNPAATAEEGALWLESLAVDLGVPKLSAYGMKKEDHEKVVEMSKGSSSMKGNPVPLSSEELLVILQQAA